MPKPTLESGFDAIAPHPGAMAGALCRLRERFQEPHRAYHNEAHTVDVLARIYEWTEDAPGVPLVAAALYHDAVYDTTRNDNEARSAELAAQELAHQDSSRISTERVVELIQMTAHHSPPAHDAGAIILTDADLYILGGTPDQYEAYRKAIRTEYNHVPDDEWRTGRATVLTRFLNRSQIFHGDWAGACGQEQRARRNIAGEIDSLSAEG